MSKRGNRGRKQAEISEETLTPASRRRRSRTPRPTDALLKPPSSKEEVPTPPISSRKGRKRALPQEVNVTITPAPEVKRRRPASPSIGELALPCFVICDYCSIGQSLIKSALFEVICPSCSTAVPNKLKWEWALFLNEEKMSLTCPNCKEECTNENVVIRCGTCKHYAGPLISLREKGAGRTCFDCRSRTKEYYIEYKCEYPIADHANDNLPHFECIDCFKSRATAAIQNIKLLQNQFLHNLSLGCPAGCVRTCLDSQTFRILGHDAYTDLKKLSASHQEEENLLTCPYSDCKAIFTFNYKPTKPYTEIECLNCHRQLCMNCYDVIHDGKCTKPTRKSCLIQ